MGRLPAFAAIGIVAASTAGGGLTGVVTDAESGRPIAGAVVTLDDLGRATVTDESGRYLLPDLPPGPQHLGVEMLGYRSRTIHVLVPAGGTLRVDLVLETEPIEVDEVVVRGRVSVRGIDAGGSDLEPRRRLSPAAIRNDPFTAEPDPLEALVGGAISQSPESGGGLHVRGGAAGEVAYLLDGIPVLSPYHVGLRSSAWSPEALASVELAHGPALATDALSGAVAATTLEPGDRLRSRGSFSTSQLRLEVDGPIARRSGFLVGARIGWPGLLNPPDEASYLRGEDHDVIGKLRLPLAGGTLRLLGFDNRNVVRVASAPTEEDGEAVDVESRNRLAWRSGTWGATWESGGEEAGPVWSVRAWRAALEASALWVGEAPDLRFLDSERRQLGLLGSARWESPEETTELGIRLGRDEVKYAVGPRPDAAASYDDRDLLRSAGGFARLRRRLGDRWEAIGELMALVDDDGAHLLPRVGARYAAGERLALFAEYVGTRQATQSLRNPESVVGRIFPPELSVASGRSAPPATSRTAIVGFVAVPRPGVRITGESYARALDGVALVAPREGLPFARGPALDGSATVRGAAVELSVGAARYGILASYGAESVEIEAGELEYAPGYAAAHRVRVGGIAHVTPTFSVRVGWIGEFGRRGTETIGVLEWESCNLLDGGCEFAGTPELLGAPGAVELPAYRRLDLSVRKHWHLRLAGRDVRLEAFGSGSNLLGRDNVLSYAVDPETGERSPIEMRPAAPVAVGIGWSF